MSLVTPFLNHTLQRVGWTLLHSLWQGAFIGVAYALLGIFLRRHSAQARYLAGCLALALLTASPIVTFILVSDAHRPVESAGQMKALLVSRSAPDIAPTATAPAGSPVPAWLFLAAEQISELTPWLALAWAFGVLVCAARLARSFWWLRTLQVTGNEPIHGDWLEALNGLRARFGISRPVRLFKSALVEVPTVLGWLRPMILLPASSVLGLTSAQLEAILAHELAHVRRFDYLVNAGQCLLETLLFYHPAVWWISAQVRQEREHCCDDLVIEMCGNKLAYARALAALEELRGQPPRFAFAATGGSLLGRIRRLLGVVDQDGTSPARRAGGLALIGIALLLVLVGVLLHLSLPRYRAIARIKLDSRESVGSSAHSSYDPYFIQTEFEIINSELVLRKAIDELGLTKKWAKKYKHNGQFRNAESLALLKPMLAIRPVRNTTFLEIGALSTDPQEASDIANAIARAYRDYHAEQRAGNKFRELNELEKRAAEQQQRINEAQDRVDESRASLGILEGAPDANNGLSTANAETFRKLESLRVETGAQLMREETLLDGLKKLGYERLTQALPTAAPDTLLLSLLEQNVFAEQKLRADQKDFGPNHPEVIKVTAQVEELQKKTHQRVEGIMLGLEERVNSLKSSLEKLAVESENLRKTEVDRNLKSRPYFKAKRELDELQRLGDSLNTSLASARVQLLAPAIPMVEIMELAEAPSRPVFPNRYRATACIILGALLSVLGFSIIRGKPGLSLHPVVAAA